MLSVTGPVVSFLLDNAEVREMLPLLAIYKTTFYFQAVL